MPDRIKRRADAAFATLKTNPSHPSLQFKQVGRYWSARVDRDFRVLAVKVPDAWVWFWVGAHQEYDRIIK